MSIIDNDYDTVSDLVIEAKHAIWKHVQKMKYCSAKMMNLDSRIGTTIYYDDDSIVVHKRIDSSLQYYGGFEYVDKDNRFDFGDYIVYMIDQNSDDGCRVKEAIDAAKHNFSKKNEDDA